jgi:hypothetical protein
MMMTAYDILEVPVGAPVGDAKRAYYRLAKQYHPDVYKGPDAHEKMKIINLAYDAIKDGRGRWWTAPTQQRQAPAQQPQAQPAPEKPSLAEMIRWANAHEFEVTNEYLLKMEVGGRDQYSKMKLPALEDTVGPVIAKRAKEAILGKNVTEDRLVGTALRWYLRGLKLDLAIRKAYVDDQFYRNAARKKAR